jgi:hypothetical protein
MRKPEFFLLGAPKCGTTALASYLSDHPLIYVSEPKEPHYFCKDLKAGGIPVHSDEEYLRTFFPRLNKSESMAAIDCSVWYLYSDVAIQEILRFSPTAQFLVMIRNPVDIAWSLHSMFTFQGQEDQKDFLTAWEMQEARRQGHNIPSGLWLDARMLLYRDVCALGRQLEKVIGTVRRDRLHIALQEDLTNDARAVYLRILDFMGVPDDGRNEFPKCNAARKVKSVALYRLLRSTLALESVAYLKKALGLKTLGFGRPDLPMPAQIRYFLSEQFEEEIEMLEGVLERDLSHWRRLPAIGSEGS